MAIKFIELDLSGIECGEFLRNANIALQEISQSLLDHIIETKDLTSSAKLTFSVKLSVDKKANAANIDREHLPSIYITSNISKTEPVRKSCSLGQGGANQTDNLAIFCGVDGSHLDHPSQDIMEFRKPGRELTE